MVLAVRFPLTLALSPTGERGDWYGPVPHPGVVRDHCAPSPPKGSVGEGKFAMRCGGSSRTLLLAWVCGQAEPEDPVVEAPTERCQGGSRSSHHRLQFHRRQLEPGEKAGAVGVFEEPAAELLIGEEFA